MNVQRNKRIETLPRVQGSAVLPPIESICCSCSARTRQVLPPISTMPKGSFYKSTLQRVEWLPSGLLQITPNVPKRPTFSSAQVVCFSVKHGVQTLGNNSQHTKKVCIPHKYNRTGEPRHQKIYSRHYNTANDVTSQVRPLSIYVPTTEMCLENLSSSSSVESLLPPQSKSSLDKREDVTLVSQHEIVRRRSSSLRLRMRRVHNWLFG